MTSLLTSCHYRVIQTITGSEKQTRWATDIVTATLTEWTTVRDHIAARIETVRERGDQRRVDLYTAQLAAVDTTIAALGKVTDAAWIINNRSDLAYRLGYNDVAAEAKRAIGVALTNIRLEA